MSFQAGSVGVTLTITIKENGQAVDISSATALVIKFDKPYGNGIFTKDAEFVTNGTDGKIKYVMEEGVLDEPGEWKVQALITLPAGIVPSNIGIFNVMENL